MIGPYDEYFELKENESPCVMCRIYEECELNSGEQESCIFRNGFNKVACGTDYICDGIGDHFKVEINKISNEICNNTKEKWEPIQPVFISAQTGKGKNYFVEEYLLEHLRKLNHKNAIDKKILVLSNRRALQYQIKHRIEEDEIY